MKHFILDGYEIRDLFFSIENYWVTAPLSDIETLQVIQLIIKNVLSPMDIENEECDDWEEYEFSISDDGIIVLTNALESMFAYMRKAIDDEPDEDMRWGIEERLDGYKNLQKKLYGRIKFDWLGTEISMN